MAPIHFTGSINQCHTNEHMKRTGLPICESGLKMRRYKGADKAIPCSQLFNLNQICILGQGICTTHQHAGILQHRASSDGVAMSYTDVQAAHSDARSFSAHVISSLPPLGQRTQDEIRRYEVSKLLQRLNGSPP